MLSGLECCWQAKGSRSSARRMLLQLVVLLGVSIGLTLWLHGSALSGNWRADDGVHLRFALEHSPWAYFFEPAVTRAQSGANLTPWNILFYDINLALFGFDPAGHYLHMLLLLAASACTLYLLLRRWLPVWPSLVASLLFLLGRPTAYMAQHLMVGHYATGLLFSLLALLTWQRLLANDALPDARQPPLPPLLIVSALLYLLATSCKEVYVPLPLIMLALPVGDWRLRLRRLWPFMLVGLLYASWRYQVLGQFLGGYTPGNEGLSPAGVASQFATIPRLLTGTDVPDHVALLLAAGLTGLALWRRKLHLWLLLASALASLLPLVPLTVFPGIHAPDRYLYVTWLGLCVLLGAGLAAVRLPALRMLAGGLLLLTVGMGGLTEKDRLHAHLQYDDTVYQAALQADPEQEGLFVPQDTGYWAGVLNGIAQAQQLAAKQGMKVLNPVAIRPGSAPPASLIVISDAAATLAAYPETQLRQRQFSMYQDGRMQVVAIDRWLNNARQRLAAGQEQPLEIRFWQDAGALHWEFGPTQGLWRVQAAGFGGLILPPQGSYPWPRERLLEAVVCQETVHWSRCSPPLRLDPRQQRVLLWRSHETQLPQEHERP